MTTVTYVTYDRSEAANEETLMVKHDVDIESKKLIQEYNILCNNVLNETTMALNNVVYSMITAVSIVAALSTTHTVGHIEDLYSNVLQSPSSKGNFINEFASDKLKCPRMIMEWGDVLFQNLMQVRLSGHLDRPEDLKHLERVYAYILHLRLIQTNLLLHDAPWSCKENSSASASIIERAAMENELAALTQLPHDAMVRGVQMSGLDELMSSTSIVKDIRKDRQIQRRRFFRHFAPDVLSQVMSKVREVGDPEIFSKHDIMTDSLLTICSWPVLHRRMRSTTYFVKNVIKENVSLRESTVPTEQVASYVRRAASIFLKSCYVSIGIHRCRPHKVALS
jgi:hypothetical protein